MSPSSPFFLDANVRLGRLAASRGQYFDSADALESRLDAFGIAGALVYSALARESDDRRGNQLLLETIRDRPRLFPCRVVIPHREPVSQVIEELRRHKIPAVRLFPVTGHFSIRPWCLEALAKALAEAGRTLFVDFEGTAWSNDGIDWEGIYSLCRAVPHLPVVVCGANMSSPANYGGFIGQCPNLHLEISELMTPGEIARLVAGGFGDRLLFGSNLPTRHPGAPLNMLAASGIDSASLGQIAHGNFERLVGRLESPARPPREITRPAGVIDTHVHLGGWNFSAAASGTMEDTIVDMDRCGIESVVATSLWACFGEVALGNDYVASAAQKYPGRIYGYLTLDPKYPDEVEQQLEQYGKDPAFRGIKLHTQTHDVFLTDPEYARILEFADAHRLPVLVHEDFDVRIWEKVCRQYAGAKFIVAHVGGGGPDHPDAVNLARLCRTTDNLYFDVAATRNFLGFLEQLVEWAGVDRILYGSDYPLMDFGFELGQVVLSRLDGADKTKILSLNARRLFGI